MPTTAAPAPSAPPAVVRSRRSHSSSTWIAPGRPSVHTLYSLCQRCSPWTASARACSRVSARWKAISTRQSRRSTVEPCCAAASSANAHCVGRACRPSLELEAIESTPMPYLPASCMPDGEIDDAVAIGMSSCTGRSLQLGVAEREPVRLVAEAVVAAQQADDHAERLVLAVAEQHRVDAVGAGIGRQGAGPGAEDRPAPGHVVELDHPLGDVERVVVGQADDAGAEADGVADLAGGGEEHLRGGDRLPARRVVLAAPELVEPEAVEVGHQLEVALEQQRRVLAGRVVRGEERTEAQAGHRRTIRRPPRPGSVGPPTHVPRITRHAGTCESVHMLDRAVEQPWRRSLPPAGSP